MEPASMRGTCLQRPWATALGVALAAVLLVALLTTASWGSSAKCNGTVADAHRRAGEQMGPVKPEEAPPKAPPEEKPPAPDESAPPKGEQSPKEPKSAVPPEKPGEAPTPAPVAGAPSADQVGPVKPKPVDTRERPVPMRPEAPPVVVPQERQLSPQDARQVRSLLRKADEDFKRWRMVEAEAGYRNVLQIDPTNVHARRRLADCLMNQERYAEARDAYAVLENLPAERPEDIRFEKDADRLAALAEECQEKLSKEPEVRPLNDLEKRAFRDQAVRIAGIQRDDKDFGGALRTLGYAEWLGREVEAPLTGQEYNQLLSEGVNHQMEAKNYAALAGLFDLADFLSIHSRERADLETQFEVLVKGEGQKIEAAARPFLAALDEEVQKRKVEDAKKSRRHRPSRLTQIATTFAALAGELVGIRQAAPFIGAAIPTAPQVTLPTGGPKYVHRATRRVDYGKIVELNERDKATYQVAPFAFTMTPAEWQAYAGVRGYAPHQPELPATVKDGPFIIAREQVGAGGAYGYFHLSAAGDPKAQVLGRFANPIDAEKALEYYLSLDPAAYSGTISHD